MDYLMYKAILKEYNLIEYDYLAIRVKYFIFNTQMGLNEIIEYLNRRTMLTRDLLRENNL